VGERPAPAGRAQILLEEMIAEALYSASPTH
jgi:hypothetical protein